MSDFKIFIFVAIMVFLFFFIFGMVLEANATTNQIPWRDYQLYENQAVLITCNAKVMHIVPQTTTSVLVICGDPGPKISR